MIGNGLDHPVLSFLMKVNLMISTTLQEYCTLSIIHMYIGVLSLYVYLFFWCVLRILFNRAVMAIFYTKWGYAVLLGTRNAPNSTPMYSSG